MRPCTRKIQVVTDFLFYPFAGGAMDTAQADKSLSCCLTLSYHAGRKQVGQSLFLFLYSCGFILHQKRKKIKKKAEIFQMLWQICCKTSVFFKQFADSRQSKKYKTKCNICLFY